MVRRADPQKIEAIITKLTEQNTRVPVELLFKYGRVKVGFVTYIKRTGWGRFINRMTEESGKFNVNELAAVHVDVELEEELRNTP